jgi:FMN phosphatase YigB (HAD superfamily)
MILNQLINERIQSISFDMDGTLYPIFKVQLRWWFQLLIRPFSALRFLSIKRTWEKRRKGDSFIDIKNQDITFFEDFLSSHLLREEDVFPEIKEIFKVCKTREIKIYFLSDHGTEKKMRTLNLSGVGQPINCLLETGELKPHPKISQLLISHYKINPQTHLHLGDRWTDEEQAKIFGSLFHYFPQKNK